VACKLCLYGKKNIKSHIIPKSFFMKIKQNENPILIIPDKIDKYPKKSHIGIYDDNLVCEDCEKVFSAWDNYADSFLIKNFQKNKPVFDGGIVIAYLIDSFDYHKLKLFFISLLWRASASSNNFYSLISTGVFEEKLKRMILDNDPGDQNSFSIIITKFDNEKLATGILSPHKEKLDGINYNSFYLGGFKVFIKVDSRESSELMKDFIMKPNSPLYIIVRNFRESNEFDLMREMAKLHRRRRKYY
jgi:hypothetical protein